jgi:Doubled CXXCH motif (Paired_CXXCH_1).
MKPLLFLLLLLVPLSAKDSCLECHSSLEGGLKTPAVRFSADIHARAGFHCTDCHGGDRTAEDPQQAMSKAKGFAGHVARTDIPKLCARCHSDAALMKKFKPQERVDQMAQYQTSVHGKRIAAGDESAATCIDCHSVHDVRAVKDALSPVYPLRLPDTCGRCHADASHMAGHKLETTQLAQYRGSVIGRHYRNAAIFPHPLVHPATGTMVPRPLR